MKGSGGMWIGRRPLLAGAALLGLSARAMGAETVRIGQATTSLSFLPLWAARAFDSFAAEGLALQWNAIPGGDPAALAALDAGDLDLAAVGADTLLAAVAKGQPFAAIGTLMGRVSLDFVVSQALLDRAKVAPGDPLAKRLAAMSGALVGVSAVGGAQDRAVRWLASQGGVDPKSVRVALVGGPPALQAALANGRIEAFTLSPPEGQIAAAGGYGHRLIGMAEDFPALRETPFLVLVAKMPAASPRLLRGTLKALATASAQVTADPDRAAAEIGQKFFPKIEPKVVRAGLDELLPGISGRGRIDAAGAAAALRFAKESGIAVDTVPADGFWNAAFLD